MVEADLEAFIMAPAQIAICGAVGQARSKSKERCTFVLFILEGVRLDLERTAHLQPERMFCIKSGCYSERSGNRANILLLMQDKPRKAAQLRMSGTCAWPRLLALSRLSNKHHSWSLEHREKSSSWKDAGGALLGKSSR